MLSLSPSRILHTLSAAAFLVTCAAKPTSDRSDDESGNAGDSGGNKSTGGSSSSSSAGTGGTSSSSSKQGSAGGSISSQAGSGGSSSSFSAGGGSSSSGGSVSPSSSSSSFTNTCTQDSQCKDGHCVNNACVCWDNNAKSCNGVCVDVRYNNNACGDCGKACPPSAPRCDSGICKCDTPPCGGATGGSGGTSSSRAGGGSSGGNASGGGGSSSASTSKGSTPVTPITNGSDGWASRYWDCCKPSCGWSENAGGKPVASCTQDNTRMSDAKGQSACQGGPAHVCWDLAPWAVSDNLAYGYAAYNGVPCGTCFQIQFTGGTHNGKAESCKALSGKTMFVQVINIGGIASNQFDIMIPGGGVGDFDACTKQWGTSDLGARYGGFLSACNGDKSCVQNRCNTVFASKPALKAGCEWFVNWYGAADNPTMKFQKVACPSELTAKSSM